MCVYFKRVQQKKTDDILYLMLARIVHSFILRYLNKDFFIVDFPLSLFF